jgi:hypothetical protein
MEPLKTYSQQIEPYLLNNFPRIVTIRQIRKLLGKVYLRAGIVETTMTGFRNIGLYRLNCNVFRSHDFAIHVVNWVFTHQLLVETGSRHLLNRGPSDFQLPLASDLNVSAVAPSDETRASTSTTPTISSSELVLITNLSSLPSI